MDFIKDISAFAGKLGPLMDAVGGVTQIFGQRQQYQTAIDVSKYNADIYKRNSDLIEAAASQRKIINEKKKNEYLSTMRAQYGFRGVDLSGSPLLAMAESASALELDIQNEEFSSLIDAQRARSAATLYNSEADAYKKAKSTATTRGIIQTASKFASEY